MKRINLIIVIGSLLSILSFLEIRVIAQELSLETIIDTNRIVIGDQVKLKYKITSDRNVNLQLPVFQQNLTEQIEIIGIPAVDSSNSDNKRELNIEMVLTAFDTGLFFIPPQPFGTFGSADTVFSKPTYLEVVGVAIDTTGAIRDIKGLEKVPVTLAEILPYFGGFILLALLGIGLFLLLNRRKKKMAGIEVDKPLEPAYISALRELDKIKAQKLWQQKQVKEYYSRVTHIMRWYIANRFNIGALEETTDEILDQMAYLKLEKANYEKLQSLLNLADMVKFAKGEPNPDENIIHLDNAYEFIKMTREGNGRDTEKPMDDIKSE